MATAGQSSLVYSSPGDPADRPEAELSHARLGHREYVLTDRVRFDPIERGPMRSLKPRPFSMIAIRVK